LAHLYGKSLGEEALYRGKDMILGPGVNIYRTPLNGRNFEYLGEDPYLSSTMVVPYIQGMQENGVAACVKHYALNNDEEHRFQVNVKVSDRALHEIYLPAFKAAVEKGHVWALMGAYNLYKDEHNCHNEYLINKILKGDWKFDGVVVSDWGGTHDTDQAVKNGLDMEFGTWTNGLSAGVSNAYDNYYLANAYKKGILNGKYTRRKSSTTRCVACFASISARRWHSVATASFVLKHIMMQRRRLPKMVSCCFRTRATSCLWYSMANASVCLWSARMPSR
jgi:beta-glucosidase